MENQLSRAELSHYGILGMKWGVRRYQNPDGSLTPAGKKRYSTGDRRKESANKKKEAAEKKAQAKYEKNRQKALTSTDPAEVAKYAKYLTDEELQTRINRTRKERELTGLYNDQNATKYFDSRKAFGQAAMTGVNGIGNGMSELMKAGTIYLGKEAVKSIFGDDVYKEMFSPSKKDKKKDDD